MDLAALKSTLKQNGSVYFRVRVIPKCQRTEWAGAMDDGAVKVRLHAVPEKGKANEELVRFLASEFTVARARVEIVSGAYSQNKLVRVNLSGS